MVSYVEGDEKMFGLGPWEIAAILIVVLLIFGPKKLPELARALGKAIHEYRAASAGIITEKETTKKNEKEEKEEMEKTLLETAEKLGIETEGKSIEEIAKEIALKAKEKGIA